MRYLGIDYGSKRIGVAISDTDNRIAFPHRVIFNHRDAYAIKKLISLCAKEKITAIVLGLPVGLDGKETEQTKCIRGFGAALKRSSAPRIIFENEMLTSRMAVASGMADEHIDASSAAIILQSYLDKMNRK